MKKIVMTTAGGHTAAAIAVVEELKKSKNWQIFWIGAKSAFVKGGHSPTFESQILPKLNIPLFEIRAGKVQRGRILETLLSIIWIPVGIIQSLFILIKFRPDALLSFGGYISLPVGFSAWVLRIPIVIHEQTASSGLANRIMSRFARRVAVSHVDSKSDFPAQKTVLTGNPVRKAIFDIAKRDKSEGETVFYITGGSRGSKILNYAVFEILPKLFKVGKVYHQTGEADLREALKLAKGNSDKYFPAGMFNFQETEKIYKKVSVVIARAGANTVSELEVLGVPAVLIPIPWVERDEQTKNAQTLAKVGSVVILPQDKLSGKTLLKAVSQALAKGKVRFKKVDGLAKKDSAKRIVDLIEEVAE